MSRKSNKDLKDLTLEAIISKYNKEAGVTVVGPLSNFDLSLEVIPTGNLMLDAATGIGGFALGKMYEVAGDKASGKSTLSISLARQHLLMGDKSVFYVDIEDASTSTLLDNFGIYNHEDRFIRSTVAIAETALDLVLDVVKTGACSLVVIDSVAALIPQHEYDKTLDDVEQIGEKAKLIQRFIQKVNPLLGVTKTTVVLINQLRTDIRKAQYNPRGNSMKSTGGKAVEYFPSFKVTLQSLSAPKENKLFFNEYGVKLAEPIRLEVGKNKLSRTCDYRKPAMLRLGFGFDVVYDLIALAELACQITYSGSWITFGSEIKVQGTNKLYELLLNDEKVRNKLVELTLPLVGVSNVSDYKKVFNDFVTRKKEKYDKNLINFSVNADSEKEKSEKK